MNEHEGSDKTEALLLEFLSSVDPTRTGITFEECDWAKIFTNAWDKKIAMAVAYVSFRSVQRQEKIQKQQIELQAEQKRILERMAEESRKASKTSRWISIISLVLAGVAISSSAAVIYYSYSWQKEQLPLLKQIVDNTQQDKESK